MFNVTLLTSRDNEKFKKKQSATFTPFLLPYNYTDYFTHEGLSLPGIKRHENEIIDLLVKNIEPNKYKDMLHSVKFDAGLSVFAPSEAIILKMHNIPIL